MKNFSKVLLAAALVIGGLGTVAPAKAADHCQNIAGGRACTTSFPNYDIIEANIPALGGSETLQITCDGGWAYQSKGDWSKSTADIFAENYCVGRGNYAHS